MVGSPDEYGQLDAQAKCNQLRNELEGLRMASSDCINKLMAQIMDYKSQASVRDSIAGVQTALKEQLAVVALRFSEEQNQLKQGISQLEKTLQQHSSILKKQTESLSFLKQAMVDMKASQQKIIPKKPTCEAATQMKEEARAASESKNAEIGTDACNCETCGLVFDDLKAALIHELTEEHHAKLDSVFTTDYPDIETGMIVEEPVPNQEGGFKCIRCNLAFMSRELLLKHMTMKLHIDIVAEELKDLIGDDQFDGFIKDNIHIFSDKDVVMETIESKIGRPLLLLRQQQQNWGAQKGPGLNLPVQSQREWEAPPPKRRRSSIIEGSDDGNTSSQNALLEALRTHLQTNSSLISQSPQSPGSHRGTNFGAPSVGPSISPSYEMSQLANLLQDPPSQKPFLSSTSMSSMFLSFVRQQLRGAQDTNDAARIRQELRFMLQNL